MSETKNCPNCGSSVWFNRDIGKRQCIDPTCMWIAPVAPRSEPVTREQQGLIRKFNVTRTDGTDALGGKHYQCFYFVLDVDHDPFALPALTAYADACEDKLPALAVDLRKWVDERKGVSKPTFSVTMKLAEPLVPPSAQTETPINGINSPTPEQITKAYNDAIEQIRPFIGGAPQPSSDRETAKALTCIDCDQIASHEFHHVGQLGAHRHHFIAKGIAPAPPERPSDGLSLQEKADRYDMMRDLEKSTLPCGHKNQFAYTPDNWKHIYCAMCGVEERDTLTAEIETLKAERDHERHEKETVAEAGKALADFLRKERDAAREIAQMIDTKDARILAEVASWPTT